MGGLFKSWTTVVSPSVWVLYQKFNRKLFTAEKFLKEKCSTSFLQSEPGRNKNCKKRWYFRHILIFNFSFSKLTGLNASKKVENNNLFLMEDFKKTVIAFLFSRNLKTGKIPKSAPCFNICIRSISFAFNTFPTKNSITTCLLERKFSKLHYF